LTGGVDGGTSVGVAMVHGWGVVGASAEYATVVDAMEERWSGGTEHRLIATT